MGSKTSKTKAVDPTASVFLDRKEAAAFMRVAPPISKFVYGGPVTVRDLRSRDELGCSSFQNGRPKVEVSTGFEFVPGTSHEEASLVVYGVLAHELLHLLRTDFAYAAKRALDFPAIERAIRHEFANVVEDAAIEYLRSDRLTQFLNDALTASIGYIWRIAPPLGDDDFALAELVSALIQFGDVGALKGDFAFAEAKAAFYDCLPDFQAAIEEPSFEKRYELSQQMFEKCRPLWEEAKDRVDAIRKLAEAMSKNGKSMFGSGDGSNGTPQDDGKEASGGAPSEANERRKKTVHLVTKKQMEEIEKNSDGEKTDDASEATDIYVVVDADQKDGGGQDGQGAQGAQAAGQAGQDGQDGQAGQAGQDGQAGQAGASGTADGGQKPSDDGQDPSGDGAGGQAGQGGATAPGGGQEASAASGSGGSDDATDEEALKASILGSVLGGGTKADAKAAKGAKDAKDAKGGEKADAGADGSPEGGGPADGGDGKATPKKQDLGKELRELGEGITQALKEAAAIAGAEFEATDEAIQRAIEIVASQERHEESEARAEAKKHAAERIDLTVESPYYDGSKVRYVNVDRTTPDEAAYARLLDADAKRRIVNLRAGFKKAFRFQNGRKEYKLNGRLDVPRFSGKKLTARLFYRKTSPEDKSDMAVVIFIDQSGSMSYKMDLVAKTTLILLEALRGFDVKVKVVGFTTNNAVTYYHYGNRAWKNDLDLAKCCAGMEAYGGTFLGHALRYTGGLLKNRPERHKLYICITDGDPCDNVYNNRSQGIKDCREAVAEVRKWADVVGIGLYENRDDDEEFKLIFQDASVSLDDTDSLVRELPKKIAKILR